MIIEIVLFQVLLINSVFTDHHDHHQPTWFYPADGVERWSGSCKGKRQSPVDITDFDIKIEKSASFQLFNYGKTITTKAQNNGHTIQLTVDPSDNLHVIGGGLRKNYELQQIHFHWQSEHTLEGKRYPLEVHFVHTADEHGNKLHSRALADKDIHVLSSLFFVNKNNNTDLTNFFNSLPPVSNVGDANKIKIIPRLFLPKDIDEFYRYEGSLTVPDCTENVQWTLFYSKIPMSSEQYEIIRSMKTFNGSFSTNFRHTQPINDRELKLLYAKSQSTKSIINFQNILFLIVVLFLK